MATRYIDAIEVASGNVVATHTETDEDISSWDIPTIFPQFNGIGDEYRFILRSDQTDIWTVAPQQPTLSLVSKTDTTINLSGTNPDNLPDVELYQDGVLISEGSLTTWELTGLNPETSYAFTMRVGSNGNWSPMSAPLTVVTDEAGSEPDLPPLNAPRDFGAQTLMSGASWTNRGMPVDYDSVHDAAAGFTGLSTITSILNGSHWDFRWDLDYSTSSEPDPKELIASGDIDVFSITDISIMEPTVGKINYGILWSELCDANDVDIYFYALHGRVNGNTSTTNEGLSDWYEDNDLRIANWETLYNAVSASQSPAARKPRMIPIGVIYKRIYDEMIAGTAPSDFNEIYVLFGDTHETRGDSHPTYIGRFIIAMAHYAVIYRRSPVGLPSYSNLTGRDEVWTSSTLQWVQELIWEECEKYPYTGIRQFDLDPEWVVSGADDELTIYRSPTGANSYTIRLVGDTNQSNWITMTGALPKTFTGLAAGDYEVSETGSNDWYGPINILGSVSTIIEIDRANYWIDSSETLTADGPNAAIGQSGDPIDLVVANVDDGDLILLIGNGRSSSSSVFGTGITTGIQQPSELLTGGISNVWASGPSGFSAATSNICLSWGLKSASVPDRFSNIGRFMNNHGLIMVLKNALDNAVVSAHNDSNSEVSAIDLPAVTGIVEGALVINIVNVGGNNRPVQEPSDCVTLMNTGYQPRLMSTYVSTEIARGSSIPPRTISINGGDVPMRAQRIVILPDSQD